MKWTLEWLNQNAHPDFAFDESIVFDPKLIKTTRGLLDLKKVQVKGHGSFDEKTSRVRLTFVISGTMVVPCAITLEPVDYAFNIDYDDCFSFKEDDKNQDLDIAKGGVIDIISLVYELIVVSIPLKVVKEGAKYPKSTGNCEIIHEDDLLKRAKSNDEIDPRLEKLKDYFNK